MLCTLATLSSPSLSGNGIFAKRPIRHLIIDEASQIDMTSEFMVRTFDFWRTFVLMLFRSICSTNTGILFRASAGLAIQNNVCFSWMFYSKTNLYAMYLVPPYGWSEGTEIQDIFQVDHLHANSRLLNISCEYYLRLRTVGW